MGREVKGAANLGVTMKILQKSSYALGLFLVLVLNPSLLFAHSYKLDSYGCHSNGKLNVYECHDGKFKDKSWPNPGGKDTMLLELSQHVNPPFTQWKGDAILSWQPNAPEDKVLGYKLYWTIIADDRTFQGPVDMGNVTSIDLTGLMRGATYYFYITAYNESGESPRSNVVSKGFK